MRRVELAIDDLKRSVEAQVPSTTGAGIDDREILLHFNDAQFHLYDEIVQQFPMSFTGIATLDVIANQQTYTLPSDLYLDSGIISVEYKYGSNSGDYIKIWGEGIHSRDSASHGLPCAYIRNSNTILLQPIPNAGVTDGLRITYRRELKTLDVRRGEISAVSFHTDELDTITINDDPTFAKDDGSVQAAADLLNRADYICIVDSDGNSVLPSIKINGYDSSTHVISIRDGQTTTLTEEELVGNYIVAGQWASTHSELPASAERFLMEWARYRLMAKFGDINQAEFHRKNLTAIQNTITTAYQSPDYDIELLPIDPVWGDFFAPSRRPLISGGGGSGSATALTAVNILNVGVGGVGLFDNKIGDNYRFKNINVGTGLSVLDDTANDEVDLALSHLGLEALIDPGADRLLFWDDSATATAWLSLGTGLQLSATTLSLAHLGLESLTNPGGDRLLFWDDSEGALGWNTLGAGLVQTAATLSVDHDATANYVADEHIAHSGVTLTAGDGITGGGDISASRTFNLDFSDLATTDTSVGSSDLLALHDGAQKKITFANFQASVDHGTISGLSDDDHTRYADLSSQAGVPGSIPSRVGNINVDLTDDRAYVATDTASSADWQRLVTPDSTDTFTNKSGNNSQWTNDSGYITDSSTDTLTNKSGNISQWTNDSGYVTPSSTTTFTNKTFDANGTGNSLSNVDVTDLADGTDGELITWDASGNPTTVGAGNAEQGLISNGAGAAPSFQNLTTQRCGFYAHRSSADENITGDGTTHTMVFDTEVFDTGDYNNSTGVFTAPEDGLYYISASVGLHGNGGTKTVGFVNIVQTLFAGGTLTREIGMQTVGTGGFFGATGGGIFELAAGDTLHVTTTVQGGSKDMDVRVGGADVNFNYFCGCWIGASP